MKKLSVFLAILMLIGALPVGFVNAIGDGGGGEDGSGVVDSVEEADVIEEGVGGIVKTVEAAENKYDPSFYIMNLQPREGILEISTEGIPGTNMIAKKLYLATINYEDGWTESEVDARLEEWESEKPEWAYATKKHDFLPELSRPYYLTLEYNIDGSRLKYDLTRVNLPDVLYYAVRFADSNDEEAGEVWRRGKIDYRGCVHSQQYQDGYANMCWAEIDYEQGTMKYYAGDVTDRGEEVISWAEEWRAELARRLGEVATKLDGVAMLPDLDGLESSLVIIGNELTNIEKLLEKAVGVEAERDEAELLRARIAALSELKDGAEEGEAEGADGGEGGVGGVEGANNSGENGVEQGFVGDRYESDEASKGEAADEGIGSDKDDDEGSFTAERDELVAIENPAGGSSVTFAQEVVLPIFGDGNNQDEEVLEQSEEVVDADGSVEVPNLGGETDAKLEKGWLWWTLIASGALALVLVLIMKRKRSCR